MNLNNIQNNKEYCINKINFHGIKKRRLYDLGFIPGEIIVKEYESVFRNPKCYRIKNTKIALRDEDAYQIEVGNE